MGPVKELVESVGLVIQQMLRTNIGLEETSKGIHHLVQTYEKQLQKGNGTARSQKRWRGS